MLLTPSKLVIYFPLLVPFICLITSLLVPPIIVPDSGVGFLVLRNMFEGGAFNTFSAPDPYDIAKDTVTFLSLWTPGQYLVPAGFIWLGSNYGVAITLTAFVATLTGIVGWVQLGRSFEVRPNVLFVLAAGLSTFWYVISQFRAYHGGELLLFAISPWALYLMRWGVKHGPTLSFVISLLSAAALFFAKLSGLIVFAANVVGLTLSALANERRLSFSVGSMWVASGIGALCFLLFWGERSSAPVGATSSNFGWLAVWYSLANAAFSGISLYDFLAWFLGHPSIRLSSGESMDKLFSYMLGPLALFLILWAWNRLRQTHYRDMALLLLGVMLTYAIAVGSLYFRGPSTYIKDFPPAVFQDRHFRYAGILFFLVLLTAVDQSRQRLSQSLLWVLVMACGLYGLKAFATGTYAQMRAGHYDPLTGISQDISPAVLDHMRFEAAESNSLRPIAVIPSASAALSLPRFRIIYIAGQFLSMEQLSAMTWAGRAEKIFVVVQQEMLLNGKAEAILRSFSSYDFEGWKEIKLEGTVIYAQ